MGAFSLSQTGCLCLPKSNLLMKKNTIIYVNFAQYDNTGRILDYLRKNFDVVLQFSYDHLRLKNGRKTNFLRIYKKGKLIEEKKMISIRTPSFLLFASLPIVAFLMFAQTVFYTAKFTKKYGKFSKYFTVNAFTGWIGLQMKKLNLVDKTIFWVWDYFPVTYPDWRIRLARWIYWKFDKPCMIHSDRTLFTNLKLFKLRQDTGIIKNSQKPIIVPVATNVKKIIIKGKKKNIIGFLGMLKKSQGVDMLIESIPHLLANLPKFSIEIIGSGPEERRFKKMARKHHKHIKFHGFIEDQNQIDKISKRWSIGTALYIPEESNESYWGDPSKIKIYISQGIPVITTNVSHFTSEIRKSKAGSVVKYGDYKGFVREVKNILKSHKIYQKRAYLLAKKYHYEKIYPKIFKE